MGVRARLRMGVRVRLRMGVRARLRMGVRVATCALASNSTPSSW